MEWHEHDQHELYYIFSGGIRTRFREYPDLEGRAGDLLFYPADMSHQPRALDRTVMAAFRWRGATGSLGSSPLKRHDLKQRALFIYQWMLELSGNPEAASREQFNSLIELLFFHLDSSEPVSSEKNLQEMVRQQLQSTPERHFLLNDLAKAASMSKFHFSRVFQRQSGLSPMKFVRNERMAMARRLLQETSLTTETIAESLGYCDASHFSRSFREHFGVNPSTYRKAAI